MRSLYALAVLVVLFGGLAYGAISSNTLVQEPQTQQVAETQKPEPTYTRNELADGTIVYELDDGTSNIQDIEPAAGDTTELNGDPSSSYKYDPWTQTHRRTR